MKIVFKNTFTLNRVQTRNAFLFINTLLIIFLVIFNLQEVSAQVPENPQVLETVSDIKSIRSLKDNEEQIKTQEQELSSKQDNKLSHLKTSKKINKTLKNVLNNTQQGNLPDYAIRKDGMVKAQSSIILPQSKNTGEVLESLHIGDILKCRIAQSFKAYENSQVPIRAVISAGQFKGGLLLGVASMDIKTKVVQINFTELRTKKDEVFTFLGGVFAKSGEELEGEYESHYWKYFWSEALLSATSGYAQSTIATSKNAFGGYEAQNSPENAAKIGMATGLSTTVKELSERAKSAPEFTKIEGPIFVEVMVLREARKI
jgi:hypothetical protein